VALATGGASCKEKERDVWNRLVAEALQNAIMTNNNDAFTSQLLSAQRTWEIWRAQDCILAGPILFDQYLTDDGIKDCEASYAARRLCCCKIIFKLMHIDITAYNTAIRSVRLRVSNRNVLGFFRDEWRQLARPAFSRSDGVRRHSFCKRSSHL